MFPAGPLREPLAVGLVRADAVVVLLPADLDDIDPDLRTSLAPAILLSARLEPGSAPPPGPQLGFAGVGKPWKVERALRAAGCQLVDFAAFPDHFAYDEANLRALRDRAETFGAGLVTTEKDWIRLPAAWRAQVAAWPVRASFTAPETLDALLAPILAEARP